MMKRGFPFFIVCSEALLHFFFLSTTAVPLERVCQIILNYKTEIDTYAAIKRKFESEYFDAEKSVLILNTVIVSFVHHFLGQNSTLGIIY
jgi:hypothetical protein